MAQDPYEVDGTYTGRDPFEVDGQYEASPTTEKTGALTTAFDAARKTVTGLASTVSSSLSRLGGQVGFGGLAPNAKKPLNASAVTSSAGPNPLEHEQDWRIRLELPPGLAASLLPATLLYPLTENGGNGVVFPFTPNITVTYAADWQSQKLTHSNYAAQFYAGSEIQDIQLQGTFVAQNQDEARYLLAVMTFFKLVTKMFFGNGDYVGNPPPVLYLYGYGKYQWNRVPVVVKNFQQVLSPDIDYISVESMENTRVPTSTDISVVLAPVYSRNQIAKFDYGKFASGELIKGGFI